MEISSQLINQNEPMIENNSFLNVTSTVKLFEENHKKDSIFDNKSFDFISNDSFNFLQMTDNSLSNSESLNILITNNSNSDVNDDSIPKDKKCKKTSERRLLMNKLSARKSRQKKKEYVKCLEEELVKLKNEESFNKKISNRFKDKTHQNNYKFFNLFIFFLLLYVFKINNFEKINDIIAFEKQNEEINKKGEKNQQNLMGELKASKNIILTKLLIRQIKYSIPLKFQLFEKKHIKLIPLSDDDSISTIISKVNNNLDKIKIYMENKSKGRIKIVSKFYEIYKNIKCFAESFKRTFIESFNY